MQSVVEFAWWCFLYPILNLPSMSCTLPLIGPIYRFSILANYDVKFPLLKIAWHTCGTSRQHKTYWRSGLIEFVCCCQLQPCFSPPSNLWHHRPNLPLGFTPLSSPVWLHLCCVSVGSSWQMVINVHMKTAGQPAVARPPGLVCVQHASLSSSVKQDWCKVCEHVCVLVCVGAARVCLDVRSVRSQVHRLQPFNDFHFGFWFLIFCFCWKLRLMRRSKEIRPIDRPHDHC